MTRSRRLSALSGWAAILTLLILLGLFGVPAPQPGLAQGVSAGQGDPVASAPVVAETMADRVAHLPLDKRLRSLVTAAEAADAARRALGKADAAVPLAGDRYIEVALKSDRPLDVSKLADRWASTPWPLGQTVTLARVQIRTLPKLAGLLGVEIVEDAAHPDMTTDEVEVPGARRVLDPEATAARIATLKAHEVPFDKAPPLVASGPSLLDPVAESAGAGTEAVDGANVADAVSGAAQDVSGAPDASDRGGAQPAGWSDVIGGHRTAKAWARGLKGEGVRVGVSDTGQDFATPELQGTWAVITDTRSAYAGWPQALDAQGLYLYVQDAQLGTKNAAVGAGGVISTTQTSRATRDFEGRTTPVGLACFRRVVTGNVLDDAPVCNYKVPMKSISGLYRFGLHPDPTLAALYGERPGILLVDATASGVYNTVYVDLDNDHDFTDEKPVTKTDPLAYRDMDGDGWVDISGGLLYWISDGVNLPPGGYLWGNLTPKPAQGQVIAFLGPWSGTHGTQCASNVVGQGKVPVPAGIELRFRDLPGNGMPPAINTGSAPRASFVGIHRGGLLVTESTYIYAAYGHEKTRLGDELQVLSNSYGFNDIVNEGWDNTSRLVDYLTTQNPNISYLYSSGNGGPGYGSIRGPNPKRAIKIAASTQMGSTGYDSITETKQITWGDIISFSSMGPASDGTLGPHVAADGAFASGAVPVNGIYDGRDTIVTWGGTSRSTPVAAGNLALVYQAFRARLGRWPTWQEARSILMAGAQYTGYDPFMAGSGVIDADASTRIAGGLDGVYATPELLVPGDYRGAVYPAFPQVLTRGARHTTTVTLTNPSATATQLDLAGQTMKRQGSYEFTFDSKPYTAESTSFSEVPDYVIPVPKDKIPAGTDLMAVRLVQPLDKSDVDLNYTASTADNLWYLRVYQHTDIDGDGKFWDDRDADGVVDKAILNISTQLDGLRPVDWANTEVDQWEYERFGQDTRAQNNETIWVHHPVERWADGMYIGLQHAGRPARIPTTQLKFRLDFYHSEDWPWLALDQKRVTVPAGGTSTFHVTAVIPDTAPYGYYQGTVFGTYVDSQPDASPYHRLTIPVQLNVAAEVIVKPGQARDHAIFLPVGYNRAMDAEAAGQLSNARPAFPDSPLGPRITLAGEVAPHFGNGLVAQDANLPYANGLVRGANRWGYGPESGDLRFFFLDVPSADEVGTRFVVRSSWQDGMATNAGGAAVPASDIDTHFFAPSQDRWTDKSNAENATENLANPAFFGPHTTAEIGASVNAMSSAGIWKFQTATGGYEDWVTAPVRPGLNQIMAHNELIAGDRIDVPFELALDRARLLPSAVRDIGSGCQRALFQPTFNLESLVSTGYGLSPEEVYSGQPIQQDVAADAATASWRREFTVAHGSSITIDVDGRDGDDLDLYLYFDANKDGIAETQVASSGSPDPDEHINYSPPADGKYMVTVHGWSVPSGRSTFKLTMTAIQGNGISVTGLPAAGTAVYEGKGVEFQICYTLPKDAKGHYKGEFVFGPPKVPTLFRMPVEVWTR